MFLIMVPFLIIMVTVGVKTDSGLLSGLLNQTAFDLRQMSLDEKIGQLLIVNFQSNYADKNIKKLISEYHIGGINFLSKNIANKEQAIKLTSDLNALSSLPLFMAVDQEGGTVVRLKFLSELTSQNKIKDTKQAEQVAFKRAQELKQLGFNMNFSPVIDNVSDSSSYLSFRTFRFPPGIAGELGEAMVDGYKKGGIVSVIKHFPGYGDIILDPHKKQADLNISKEKLQSNLLPFKNIIKNKKSLAVMTAHIIIPAVSRRPATVSPEFINQILRKDLGFNGVVITDDLSMVSAGDSIGQLSVDSIKAGVDIVIAGGRPIDSFNALKQAVLTGEISEERINESVNRILRLKSEIK